ncbi:MAG: hypothetical protein ATN32_00875 [Candidatus Epulonipiscium fishelsonii]|nr:MAG: hypothetical protein ATN32_00875 [Epulopiscium sp. AS2M-Bin002]
MDSYNKNIVMTKKQISKNLLQNLPVELIELWFNKCKNEEEIVINLNSGENTIDTNSYLCQLLTILGYESFIAVPLTTNDGDITGYIAINFIEMDKNDKLILKAVCKTISEFIRKYKIIKGLSKQIQISEIIIQCIELLNYSKDFDKSIENLLEIVATYYGGDRSYIVEISKDRKFINNTHEWVKEGFISKKDLIKNLPIQLVEHWLQNFEKEGEFIISSVREMTITKELYNLLSFPLKILDHNSFIAVPLKSTDGVITGYIAINYTEIKSYDTTVLKAVCKIISEFMRKNEMIDKLEKMSYFDNLTQLKNRNAYLERHVYLKENITLKVGIAFVDINGLKLLNDTKGHIAGDKMIIEISTILYNIFGENVYRIGGDEFVILQNNVLEEKFIKSIEQVRYLIRKNPTLSASIGYIWTEVCDNIDDIIHQADELMYIEKQCYYKKKENNRKIS